MLCCFLTTIKQNNFGQQKDNFRLKPGIVKDI